MDQIDLQIVQLLQTNARISLSDIGRKISLSTPAVSSRIQKLQEQGVIKQFVTVVDPSSFGKGICAFCLLIFRNDSQNGVNFTKFVESEPDIVDVFCISGEYEYLLKIVTSSPTSLENLLKRLRNNFSNAKTKTYLVLSHLKSSPFSIN